MTAGICRAHRTAPNAIRDALRARESLSILDVKPDPDRGLLHVACRFRTSRSESTSLYVSLHRVHGPAGGDAFAVNRLPRGSWKTPIVAADRIYAPQDDRYANGM